MLRNEKLVYGLFIFLAIILCSIAVGYAALSTTLHVTANKVSQNAQTWNIAFDTGTVTGVGTGSNMVSCGSATAQATTISGFNIQLGDVGDKCAYTFKIANNGTIAGRISTINITKPASTSCTTSGSTMVCGNITYKLHYNTATSTSLVAVNDTIAAKSGSTATKKTVVLTVEHTGTNPGTADYKQLSFAYDITFVQN